MKRDRDRGKAASAASSAADISDGKSKNWAADSDAGMDELLAVLGYKVKSSDMSHVAQKLEQLEMAMATATASAIDGGFSDTVHYNPSDLSGWVQSVLSEFSDSCPIPADSSSSNSISFPKTSQDHETNFVHDDDLSAIFGTKKRTLLPNGREEDENAIKRQKSNQNGASPAARPVVMVDSQETGIRLVHTLMACAEAIHQDNMNLANALLKHVGILAAAQTGAMRKVAKYFAKALARKIYNVYPKDPIDSDALLHFYEAAPYLKFAHFTANQAILAAFSGATRVHVIDFNLKQGMQWPELMQALALREEGPPVFRLTGIGSDNMDALQEVGWQLGQFARTLGVEFEFHGIVANSFADLNAEISRLRPEKAETVAVSSVFELHRLLAHPGAIEKVLKSISSLNPKIVTVVEQEASHNSAGFLDRFNEALHYYSTMFDSLESSGVQETSALAEVYLGSQICNVVACEGADRVERHEPVTRWRDRMKSAGFSPVHLGSDVYRRASMLLAHFTGGNGYGVQENEGCLMLGWHSRVLVATSAWRLTAAAELC